MTLIYYLFNFSYSESVTHNIFIFCHASQLYINLNKRLTVCVLNLQYTIYNFISFISYQCFEVKKVCIQWNTSNLSYETSYFLHKLLMANVRQTFSCNLCIKEMHFEMSVILMIMAKVGLNFSCLWCFRTMSFVSVSESPVWISWVGSRGC